MKKIYRELFADGKVNGMDVRIEVEFTPPIESFNPPAIFRVIQVSGERLDFTVEWPGEKVET